MGTLANLCGGKAVWTTPKQSCCNGSADFTLVTLMSFWSKSHQVSLGLYSAWYMRIAWESMAERSGIRAMADFSFSYSYWISEMPIASGRIIYLGHINLFLPKPHCFHLCDEIP